MYIRFLFFFKENRKENIKFLNQIYLIKIKPSFSVETKAVSSWIFHINQRWISMLEETSMTVRCSGSCVWYPIHLPRIKCLKFTWLRDNFVQILVCRVISECHFRNHLQSQKYEENFARERHFLKLKNPILIISWINKS